MNRIFLIARREFAAYAKTAGFWLSLLAFPLFAVVGGAVPIMMRSNEPVRAVALVEEGAQASGLAAAVRDALSRQQAAGERTAEEARQAAARMGAQGGMAEEAIARLSGPRIRLLDAPARVVDATSGPARDAAARALLDGEDEALDAVVILSRATEGPAARVWTRSTTDDTVEDFVRSALREANRAETLSAAGIDPAVVRSTEAFRPTVTVLSPRSASGGEVSFRDRLPQIIGLASGFLLWSLIITGASILLNSVMEEKSNKILEVLLSSASPGEILAGKVLGVALLTATVLLAWGGLGAVGLFASFPKEALDVAAVIMEGGMLWYFLAYAVGGYLMYAVLFAAIGAFCETPRDAQTLMGPIMMILVVPLLFMQMALQTPDAPLVRIFSWVPFFTPFLMSARAPSGPPAVEIVGTMLGMFAFAALMVWLSGRAFRAGALSDVKLNWKSFLGAVRGGA